MFNQPCIPTEIHRGRRYISHGNGGEEVFKPHPQHICTEYTVYVFALFYFLHALTYEITDAIFFVNFSTNEQVANGRKVKQTKNLMPLEVY